METCHGGIVHWSSANRVEGRKRRAEREEGFLHCWSPIEFPSCPSHGIRVRVWTASRPPPLSTTSHYPTTHYSNNLKYNMSHSGAILEEADNKLELSLECHNAEPKSTSRTGSAQSDPESGSDIDAQENPPREGECGPGRYSVWTEAVADCMVGRKPKVEERQ
ncbi:hypothetical protein FRB95_002566 [Tulasnella sp. JGI-2019a]|nr:hypothetical protein FRB95_002566 [Tulasnella sp. JGI-2019a]